MLGRTIGKYRVVERIGRGGMGTVYRAVDETLDRDVAIKVLNPDLGETEVVKRFRAEAMTLARLNHPGIATIYELYRTDDDLLMVMEFVRGETFDRIVERVGPLPTARAASLGAQVLDALGHAHRVGIVHRDLKPANLMLTEYGSIKIMDFGIARVLGTEHITSDGLMMGTPAYMAPEQVLATDVDARADLYSVGVVLYRLLSGNLPFKADTAIAMAHKQLKDPPTPLRQFRAELPAWCEDVLARALAKSPVDRFQTAEEFRDALVGYGASLVPVAASAAQLETTLPPDRESGGVPAVLAGAASPAPAVSAPGEARRSMAGAGEPVGGQQDAAYAATLPVATPSGVALPRAGTPPQAKAHPASPLPSAPHRGAEGAEGGGPQRPSRNQKSGPEGSTTVILRKQHLAVAAGLFGLLVLAIGGLALVVMRGPQASSGAAASATSPEGGAPAAPSGSTPAPAPDVTDPAPASAASPPASSGSAPRSAQNGAAERRPGSSSASAPPSAALRARDRATAGAATPIPPRSTPAEAADATGARGRGTARDAGLPPLTVTDIRVIVAEDRRAREREATMTFAVGTLTVAEKNGPVVRSVPYEAILSVHYSRTRQPMWQSPGGPAPVMRVGGGAFGMFRSEPHWLAVRMKEAFLVLRVGPEHVRSVPAAFSDRAGVTVTTVRARAR